MDEMERKEAEAMELSKQDDPEIWENMLDETEEWITDEW